MLGRSVKLLRKAKPNHLSRGFNFNVMSLLAAHHPNQEQPNLTTVRLSGDSLEKKTAFESLDL